MVVLGRSIVTIGLVLAATTACTGATVAEPVASRAGSATIHSATISPTPGLATRSALPRAAVTRVVSPLLFGLYPGVADAPNVVSGSSRLLQGVQWADLNPTAKPKDYNWAPLDAQVRSGVAHGVRDFLLVLGMTPHWASRSGTRRTSARSGPAPPRRWLTSRHAPTLPSSRSIHAGA